MAVQILHGPLSTTVISGFDWDRGNRSKCQRHGVPPGTVEDVFKGTLAVLPDPAHSETEERFKAIGATPDGRRVLVIFTLRRKGGGIFIRPISVRYMHAKEVSYYEEAIAEAEKRQGG